MRQLLPCTPLLQEIGVETQINYTHIQLVLEAVYKLSDGQTLTQKARDSVFTAIRKLIELLIISADSPTDHIDKIVSPLYLPNSENKLALSTTMLYIDDTSINGLPLNLKETGFTILQIQSVEYGIFTSEKVLCEMLLPKEVRPIALSTKFSKSIIISRVVSQPGSVETSLKETFSMRNTLSRAIAACVQHYAKNVSTNVEDVALEFITNLSILTYENLKISITCNQTGSIVGIFETNFSLLVDKSHVYLHLDSRPNKRVLYPKIISLLSSHLLQLIRVDNSHIAGKVYASVLRVVTSLFTAQNPDEVTVVLKDYCISVVLEGLDNFTPKVGQTVPECWYHRLDQSVDSHFYPGEVVGCEVMGETVVCAKIICPILPDGIENFTSISNLSLKFRICTNMKDEEETVVSVLKLYKFLRAKQVNRTVALDQLQHRESTEENIYDFRQQLDSVWILPDSDQRSTAFRRLYLKSHPDSNPNIPSIAKAVFKFLISEIEQKDADKYMNFESLDRSVKRRAECCLREQDSLLLTGRDKDRRGAIFDEENLHPSVNHNEGRRWLKQAETSFKALLLLHSQSVSSTELCGNVCFLAQQVAECALKGAMYFVCGLDDSAVSSHTITTLAYGLQYERPKETSGLTTHTVPLENYYLDPRYSCRWPSGVVPADQYSYTQADEAKNHAQAILDIVKCII